MQSKTEKCLAWFEASSELWGEKKKPVWSVWTAAESLDYFDV